MKRLKLHKKKHLKIFIEDCVKVVSYPNRFDVSIQNDMYALAYYDKIKDVYEYFSRSSKLFADKYYCLLKPEVRNTFVYYANLSHEKRIKKLSKKLK